jgi:ABC-type iron transport system FetAB permease component
MAVTGVVSLPGMMTWQILGGMPPPRPVKYRILVIFPIAGGTGLGAVTPVLGGVYRLTEWASSPSPRSADRAEGHLTERRPASGP